MTFVPGQNAPLQAPVVTFRAESQTPFDVSALVADANLRALTSADFVFYNQPSTAGVQLDQSGIRVELDRLHPDAAAVLCIVSVDPAATAAGAFRTAGLSATLSDQSGSVLAEFAIPTAGTETAVICWELYRKSSAWKIRAVGQGYAGGLAELISVHGVEVDDEPAQPSPTAAPAWDSAVEPLEVGRGLERAWMIFEDASRSAASFVSSSEYALARLDEDLTAAVADPSLRNSAAGVAARDAAQKRHDDLVSLARDNHARDSAQLAHELGVIDGVLPRSMASWKSVSWAGTTDPAQITAVSDGMRLGELSAPDRGTLTVPYCVPLPLRRTIWVDSTSSKAALGLISAVTVRVMAAGPMPLLDVVDLTGSLTPLTDRLAPMLAGPVITAHTEISARLRALAEAVDMGELARMSGVADGPSSLRLLILSDFPHGYSAEDAQTIMFLAERGPAIGLSILIVGEDESNFAEESVAALSEGCQHLSAAGQTEVHDPWTRTQWHFTPDVLDPISESRILAVFDRT